jgi:hypothetical protein
MLCENSRSAQHTRLARKYYIFFGVDIDILVDVDVGDDADAGADVHVGVKRQCSSALAGCVLS